MKITREDVGTLVVQQLGSYTTRTDPPRRKPRHRLVMILAINPADDFEHDVLVKSLSPTRVGTWPTQWTHSDKLSPVADHLVPGFAVGDRVKWVDGTWWVGTVVSAVLDAVIVQSGTTWHYFGEKKLADGKQITDLTNLTQVTE